jgi:hypothetical protein
MDARSIDIQVFFYRVHETSLDSPCTRYIALVYGQATAKRGWHTGKTLMGLRESFDMVTGVDWEAVEEGLTRFGHHNCVAVAEHYDFGAPLIQ